MTITMIDTVSPNVLRGLPDRDAFAGYVVGSFADLETIERDYPGHKYISITPTADAVADFCDCEPGDLEPDEVVGWILRMHKAGVWRPGVYASGSTLREILPGLARRLPRAMYRVWGADWNGEANVPEGWDAHQYENNKARDIDLSACLDDFFPTVHTHPKPKPKPEHHDDVFSTNVDLDVSYDTKTRRWDVKFK